MGNKVCRLALGDPMIREKDDGSKDIAKFREQSELKQFIFKLKKCKARETVPNIRSCFLPVKINRPIHKQPMSNGL